MATVACNLPARPGPDAGRPKVVSFGGGGGDKGGASPHSQKVAPTTEAIQQLRAWLEAEVKVPLTAIEKRLDQVDTKVGKLDSKMQRCLGTVSELAMKSFTASSRRQGQERGASKQGVASEAAEAPAEEPASSTPSTPSYGSRRESRCSTLPARGQKMSISGVAINFSALQVPIRSAARKNTGNTPLQPLQVLPEFTEASLQPSPPSPSSVATTSFALPKVVPAVLQLSDTVEDLAKGNNLSASRSQTLPELSLGPQSLQAPQQSPSVPPTRTSTKGSIGRPSIERALERSAFKRVSSVSVTSSARNPSLPPLPVMVPPGARARRRPSIESLGSCASSDSLFETRAQLTKAAFRQGQMFHRIWRFLEDSESSRAAHWYRSFTTPLIMLSTVLSFAQTIEPSPVNPLLAAIVESSVEIWWAVEIIMRFLVCPSRRAFFLNPYNVIDIVSSAPPLLLRGSVGFILPASNDEASSSLHVLGARYVLLCIVPVLRLLKILRHFETFQLLLSAFRQVLEALPVLLYTQLLLTLVFSSLIFLVEPRDNINSLPTAAWLTIVTMTTVGYGDVTPASPAGSFVVSCLVISSVIFTSFPLGIIGSTFTAVWSDRDRILLMQKTRDCLDQWGYTAHDVVKLFKLADLDGDDELNIEEFQSLMDHMKLGLNEERVIELFQSFDYDNSGAINHEEFCRVLFPGVPMTKVSREEEGSLSPPLTELERNIEEIRRGSRSSNSSSESESSSSSEKATEDVKPFGAPAGGSSDESDSSDDSPAFFAGDDDDEDEVALPTKFGARRDSVKHLKEKRASS